jgi:hypothetical protein
MTCKANIACRHRQDAVLTANTMSSGHMEEGKNGERGMAFPASWTAETRWEKEISLTPHHVCATADRWGGDALQVPSGHTKSARSACRQKIRDELVGPKTILNQASLPRAIACLGRRPHYWSASHAATIARALGQASCALTDDRRPSRTAIHLGQ